MLKKRPISRFDAREGLGRSKTSPSRRNASRRGGGGEETPRLAFRHEGGSGEVENTPLASKREPKRGAGSAWVPNTSVSKGMFAKGGRDLVG